jgi:hypothetical protein
MMDGGARSGSVAEVRLGSVVEEEVEEDEVPLGNQAAHGRQIVGVGAFAGVLEFKEVAQLLVLLLVGEAKMAQGEHAQAERLEQKGIEPFGSGGAGERSQASRTISHLLCRVLAAAVQARHE